MQPDPIPSVTEPRKSTRVRIPSKAAVEQQKTEELYGRKSRSQRRREEKGRSKSKSPSQRQSNREERTIRDAANLAVAIELHLGDFDDFEFVYLRNLRATIPILKNYKEAIADPEYGPKWREVVKRELTNLMLFGI